MADVSTASLSSNELRAITFAPGREQPQVHRVNVRGTYFLVDNPDRHVYNASQQGRERLPD
jgi:hypothetical protein